MMNPSHFPLHWRVAMAAALMLSMFASLGHAATLDRLRAVRKLPEQADFRAWKADFLTGYRSVEQQETWWHLPDRRTLRVVINPNPQGGVTYLFDDVSERFELASQVNSLTQVQGETLNTLKEGVAVFGSDGRLKLHNRAFADMWDNDDTLTTETAKSVLP